MMSDRIVIRKKQVHCSNWACAFLYLHNNSYMKLFYYLPYIVVLVTGSDNRWKNNFDHLNCFVLQIKPETMLAVMLVTVFTTRQLETYPILISFKNIKSRVKHIFNREFCIFHILIILDFSRQDTSSGYCQILHFDLTPINIASYKKITSISTSTSSAGSSSLLTSLTSLSFSC